MEFSDNYSQPFDLSAHRVSEELRAYSYDLDERCLNFGLSAIDLYRELDRSERSAQRLSDQFLRAASSIGANLEEARAAESRRDFAHKHALALKEARETRYWLLLFKAASFLPASAFEPLMAEATEPIAILTTIVAKTRR